MLPCALSKTLVRVFAALLALKNPGGFVLTVLAFKNPGRGLVLAVFSLKNPGEGSC